MTGISTNNNIGKLAAAAFASAENAEAALNGLIEDEFDEDQIGIITSTEGDHLVREWLPNAQEASANAAGTQVAVGGLLGGLLGGAAALAIPGVGWALGIGIIATTIAGGSFGAGLVGPLQHLKMGQEHAMYLDERLRAGEIIITVHDDQRSGEAQQILHKFGGTSPAVI